MDISYINSSYIIIIIVYIFGIVSGWFLKKQQLKASNTKSEEIKSEVTDEHESISINS